MSPDRPHASTCARASLITTVSFRDTVLCQVDAAFVRMLDRLTYGIASVEQDTARPASGTAPGSVGLRRLFGGRERIGHPLRRREPGKALVGHRPALGVTDDQGDLAVLVELCGSLESAVAVVHQAAGAERAVRQDRRAVPSLGCAVARLRKPHRLCVVERVDGDELTGRLPGVSDELRRATCFRVAANLKATPSLRRIGITVARTSAALRLVAEMWSFQPCAGSCMPAGTRWIQVPECVHPHWCWFPLSRGPGGLGQLVLSALFDPLRNPVALSDVGRHS